MKRSYNNEGYSQFRNGRKRGWSAIFKLLLGVLLLAGTAFVGFEANFLAPQLPLVASAQLSESSPPLHLPVVSVAAAPAVKPSADLPVVSLDFSSGGRPVVDTEALLVATEGDRFAAQSVGGNLVYFTPDLKLQKKAEEILKRHAVPWGAIVAIDPETGTILALASHSTQDPGGEPVALRSTFPAASLFKVITAAAAIEQSNLRPQDIVSYRGGDYTLNKSNFLPDRRRDARKMSFKVALGKSCNPVFGRIGLESLTPNDLQRYAESFGFNAPLASNFTLPASTFELPKNDFEQALTAAGFGPVYISPLHAALLAASLANEGVMMRPRYVDEIRALNGRLVYRSDPEPLRTVVMPSTAAELLQMLRSTVEEGTARKTFKRGRSTLNNYPIAAKTGTLSGTNPRGRYHWLIAAAPTDRPTIAVAALVIDGGTARIGGTGLAKEFLEYYFSKS